MNFGFYPLPLDLTAGDVAIKTLDDLDSKVTALRDSEGIEGDWCHAPPQEVQGFTPGVVRVMPYSSRVFGLPHTHSVAHASSTDPERLRFLIWMLGFIHGLRLTDTEAGFLDATPIKPGILTDIVWRGDSHVKAVTIADVYWQKHAANPRIAKAMTGVVHSLFLSQTPRLLEFEAFIYLYIAMEGCHAVWCYMNNKNPLSYSHSTRIANLCAELKRPVPDWADKTKGSDTIIKNRNDTIHEGLFFDAPLGFEVYGGNAAASGDRNIPLEMRCLVCRFICGIMGFNDFDYIRSSVNTRSRFGVRH